MKFKIKSSIRTGIDMTGSAWREFPTTQPPKAGVYWAKFPSGHKYKLRFDGKWEWPDCWRSSRQPVAWSFLNALPPATLKVICDEVNRAEVKAEHEASGPIDDKRTHKDN